MKNAGLGGLYSNQVRIPDGANYKLLLTMGLTHYEPGNLNRYWYKAVLVNGLGGMLVGFGVLIQFQAGFDFLGKF